MRKNRVSEKYRVVGLGDLVVDIISRVDKFPIQPGGSHLLEKMDVQPGGMANFLIAGKKLGLETMPVDIVGADLFGKFLLDTLTSLGIDMGGVERLPEVSSKVVLILADSEGRHAFLGHLGNNQPRLGIGYPCTRILEDCQGLFVVGYSLLEDYIREFAIRAMEKTKRRGGMVFFDPGPMMEGVERESILAAIRNSTVLLMTDEEQQILFRKAGLTDAREVLTMGPSLLCIKIGPAGCEIITPEKVVKCPGYQVEVLDTSGAGDSFAAAFMYGMLHGYSLEETGRLANAMGAAMVAKFGTGLNVPGRIEVLDILRKNNESIPKDFQSMLGF
jgi:sugar/nucleoside kinase (ribokinase family)